MPTDSLYPDAPDVFSDPVPTTSLLDNNHMERHSHLGNAVEAMQSALGLLPLSKDAAEASDHLARIKAAADAEYRLSLGLDSSSAPQLLFGGGGAVAPDVRIRRDAATGLLLDNGAGGLGRLNITGSLRADFTGGPGSTPLFEVNATDHRVGIGGGQSVNLLTIGKRSTSQIEVIVGSQSAYLKGRFSTALTTPLDTQANLNFTPTDWDGAATRELASSIAARADGSGSALFIWDMPGNEPLHLNEQGLLRIFQWALGDGLSIEHNDDDFSRFVLSYDGQKWGPGNATHDIRLRRTGASELEFDDGAGGDATVNIVGELQVNGSPVGGDGGTPDLNLFIGPISPWFMTAGRAVSADRAHFEAFTVPEAVTVDTAHCYLTGSAGNVDIGIYSGDPTTPARLGSTGSVAAPTANTWASIPLTAPVALVPGVKYYAAFGSTSASTNFFAVGASVVGANTIAGSLGMGFFLATSIPLPATVTNTPSNGYSGVGVWFSA